MALDPDTLARWAAVELERRADPRRAREMAAYMKTDEPFRGVPKPARDPLVRAMKTRFAPQDRSEYEAGVLALWREPWRESQYLALDFARLFLPLATLQSLPLWERLIREAAWWDRVDALASTLVGPLLLRHRPEVSGALEGWVRDPHLWLRRSALLAHLNHKRATDWEQLGRHCLLLAGEREFFIRKAIGWVLRQYARTDPGAVLAFLDTHGPALSGLSRREAMRHLGTS